MSERYVDPNSGAAAQPGGFANPLVAKGEEDGDQQEVVSQPEVNPEDQPQPQEPKEKSEGSEEKEPQHPGQATAEQQAVVTNAEQEHSAAPAGEQPGQDGGKNAGESGASEDTEGEGNASTGDGASQPKSKGRRK